MDNLTIVMYHYVRDLKRSRYPEIKALPYDLFKKQVCFLKKNYNIISAEDLYDCFKTEAALPAKAALLTFDDGYLDHFQYVFPVLDELEVSACFFPSAKCILERKMLLVNKIHFILASVEDKKKIVNDICKIIDDHGPEYGLPGSSFFLRSINTESRFDVPEVVFIKKMLQRELPQEMRQNAVDFMFSRHVTKDESAFAQELYMTTEQLQCLKRNGMYIGSHGYGHNWMDRMSYDQLIREIDLSLKFLEEFNGDVNHWMMCYPYGAFNELLINMLRKKGCVIGFTTEPRIANLRKDSFMTLPRLDTNDILKFQEASLCT